MVAAAAGSRSRSVTAIRREAVALPDLLAAGPPGAVFIGGPEGTVEGRDTAESRDGARRRAQDRTIVPCGRRPAPGITPAG